MKKILITVKEEDSNNAGPKATNDIIKFLNASDDYSVKTLNFDLTSKIKKLIYNYITIPNFFKNLKADIIIFQYPAYSEYLMKTIMKSIKKYTNAKLYLIIHDIETLRLYKDRPDYVANEMIWLKQADGIVVHNNQMHNWLSSNGITNMVDLNLFDYDNPQKVNDNFEYDKSICFAGNLAKAKFLTLLSSNNTINVYGPNPVEKYSTGVNYLGQYAPDELPKHLRENFGLVWDGASLNTCNGVYGEYMRYNSPHKVSLYLSTGMPVIIWKEAALANYIVTNNIGIAVDSLENIDKIVDTISEDEFKIMKNNAICVASKLRNGTFIKEALSNLDK